MRNRTRQVDMTHALTPHFSLSNLNATLFADYAAMLETLVLTTQAFVILNRAKNLGTEQAVTLWLEGTIVNGLRFLNLTKRPRSDHFGGSQSDANRIKVFNRVLCLVEPKQIFHKSPAS